MKPLELRAVDHEVEPPTLVIRPHSMEVEEKEEEEPILLVPQGYEENISRTFGESIPEPGRARKLDPEVDVLIDKGVSRIDLFEDAWGKGVARRAPVPWGWFALVGLLLAGALAWSLTHVREADEKADEIRSQTRSTLGREEQEKLEAGRLIARIEETLRRFFDTTTVESRARLVRHRERVLPLMKRHYEARQVFSSRVKSIKMLQPLTLENRGNFWMAHAHLANGDSHSMILEIAPSGQPLVDWETLVCYQPMLWDDFATQRPTGSSLDFRVYVEKDHFYSHEFNDATQWASYRLTALDSGETLFGYVQAGGREAKELDELIQQSGGRWATLILRLRCPEGLQSRRGVIIEKILSSRWLYLDSPDSGS